MVNSRIDSQISIWLPESFYDCPKYWQNFANYVNPKGYMGSYDIFNYILTNEYNVTYYGIRNEVTGNSRRITFASPEDLLYFKLKWS